MRASRLFVGLVVIVTTIALVAACGSSKTSDTHASHTKTRTIVKTVTAPTTTTKTFTSTTTTGTATTPPRTTTAASTPECNVNDLEAVQFSTNGAAGTEILTFALKNDGAASCVTYGWPGIGFLSSAGAALPTTPTRVTHDALGSTGKPVKLTLAPGQEASFRVTVSNSGSGSSCVNSPTIEITPPNDTAHLQVKLSPAVPTCGSATVTPMLSGTSAQPAGT